MIANVSDGLSHEHAFKGSPAGFWGGGVVAVREAMKHLDARFFFIVVCSALHLRVVEGHCSACMHAWKCLCLSQGGMVRAAPIVRQ